ncbi:MAG: UDP-galactopyranose mutase [Acetatifactor sp.]|nr:UDP-galactopyranose mutase [Acetatifactor sp.]
MHYDYLIVGAGLFGAVFANEMKKAGKTCLCIDKRRHIAGNIYTEKIRGIDVHRYGAHIFHTSDKKIWDYINGFGEFNNYVNSPMAVYGDEIYNLPFNMNTFSKMWNIKTPEEAKKIIESQKSKENVENPKNLEEQALKLVGRDVYEKLIKDYTEKQWGRPCNALPSFIIKRLPVRFTYDNNYFNDRYQGIPVGGYTKIIEKMFEGTKVCLNEEFRSFMKKTTDTFGKILYTGMIDEYFDHRFGSLEYRSLEFKEEDLPEVQNYQGCAVVNYTKSDVPYTRIIEHKHFTFGKDEEGNDAEGTVITKEYSKQWQEGDEPYYPVNNEENNALYEKYRELSEKEKNVIFGGRLGMYKYLDMDKIIGEALSLAHKELQY